MVVKLEAEGTVRRQIHEQGERMNGDLGNSGDINGEKSRLKFILKEKEVGHGGGGSQRKGNKHGPLRQTPGGWQDH